VPEVICCETIDVAEEKMIERLLRLLHLSTLALTIAGAGCLRAEVEPGAGDSDSDSDTDSDSDSDTDSDSDSDTDSDSDSDTDTDTDSDTDTGTGSDTGDSDSCMDCAYAVDFEADDGGYVATGSAQWTWGSPSSGPYSAHSGSNLWATNLYGAYDNYWDGDVTSPDIDLSGCATPPSLRWWHWYDGESCCDYISVEISNNGGSTWTTIYGPYDAFDITSNAWTEQTYALSATYLVSNFRVRFHFDSDVSIVYDGWYVDDVSVTLDGCD
jgi:hypothetical protein